MSAFGATVTTELLSTGRVLAPRVISGGATQIQGPPGRDGASFAFGQVRYGEATGSAPVIIPANLRTLLTFAIDPSQTNNFLNPPFEGLALFDGTTIRARAMGDLTNILVNLLVTSLVVGGQIKFDIDVGSPLGPTGTDTAGLFAPAGVPERVTGRLTLQTLTYFLANGAKLYITSSVPISLVNEALIIMPASIFAGL